MDDDRLERLLKGYQVPHVSTDLDHRVLGEGAAILEHARARATAEEVGWSLLDRLGFGYLAWVVDFVTSADAEYRVIFI